MRHLSTLNSQIRQIRQIRQIQMWALVFAIVLGVWACPAQARELDFQPLSPRRVEKLNTPARQAYERTLTEINHINYAEALEQARLAVAAEPDNPHLRFAIVQLAQYLGDTRNGNESIHYYDLALENLKVMLRSSQLNAREKQRTQSVLETVSSLRQTVRERDEQRRLYGLEIAIQYDQEANPEPQPPQRQTGLLIPETGQIAPTLTVPGYPGYSGNYRVSPGVYRMPTARYSLQRPSAGPINTPSTQGSMDMRAGSSSYHSR